VEVKVERNLWGVGLLFHLFGHRHDVEGKMSEPASPRPLDKIGEPYLAPALEELAGEMITEVLRYHVTARQSLFLGELHPSRTRPVHGCRVDHVYSVLFAAH
jgi:hypothetical protein